MQEAVSLGSNGRLWRHDLDTGSTRLVAEGFHFVDGVLYDLHPGLPREQSILVSQTAHFRLTRFWLAGPKAGSAQIVLDGITGMPDGLDRDTHGNIWTGLIKAGVFGLILTLTGCVRGYYTTGGAEGVGRATTYAVVSASLIILLADFFLTKLLF